MILNSILKYTMKGKKLSDLFFSKPFDISKLNLKPKSGSKNCIFNSSFKKINNLEKSFLTSDKEFCSWESKNRHFLACFRIFETKFNKKTHQKVDLKKYNICDYMRHVKSVTCIKLNIFVVIQNIYSKILCDFFAFFSDKKYIFS